MICQYCKKEFEKVTDKCPFCGNEINMQKSLIDYVIPYLDAYGVFSAAYFSSKYRWIIKDEYLVKKSMNYVDSCQPRFVHFIKEYNDNKDMMLLAVSKYGSNLEHVSDRLKDDYDIVEAAVKDNGEAFIYASKRLKFDKRIIAYAAINKYTSALDFLDYQTCGDIEFMLPLLQHNSKCIKYVSEEIKNDRNIYLQNPLLLAYAPKVFGEDKELIENAIKKRRFNYYECAIDVLKKDRDLAVLASQYSLNLFSFCEVETWKNDFEICMNCIRRNFHNLNYIGDSIKKDRDSMLNIIKYFCDNKTIYGHDIGLITVFINLDSFRDDLDFALSLFDIIPKEFRSILKGFSDKVKNNQKFIDGFEKYYKGDINKVSNELKHSKEYMLELAQNIEGSLECIPMEFQNDKVFLKHVLQVDPYSYIYLSDELKEDSELINIVVPRSSYVLKYLPKKYCDNKEIVLESFKFAKGDSTDNRLEFVSDRLRDDFDVIKTAVSLRGNNLEYASKNLKKNKEIVEIAINQNLEAIRFADKSIRSDYDFFYHILLKNPELFKYSGELKKNKTFCALAIALDYRNRSFVHKDLKDDEDLKIICDMAKKVYS